MVLKSRLALAGIAICAGASWALAEDAGRVDEAACAGFAKEKTLLDTSAIAADIERGAQWGKENLAPERLRQISRYIFLDEKLTFRCPNVLATAAVRQMEEQARLKAMAALERERLWNERLAKISPPDRKPETKVARARTEADAGVPPLPERKSR